MTRCALLQLLLQAARVKGTALVGYLLKKPLTAVPVTEDEEVVISPTRTDPRAIAAAFCNEKGIPLSDPHRCEVERTVRYVIEQSLIPQYRTLPHGLGGCLGVGGAQRVL